MSITPKMAIEECIGGQKIPSIIHSHRFLSLWGWNSTLPSFEIQVEKQGFIASNNRMDVESSKDPTPYEQWSSVTGLDFYAIKEIFLTLNDTDDG